VSISFKILFLSFFLSLQNIMPLTPQEITKATQFLHEELKKISAELNRIRGNLTPQERARREALQQKLICQYQKFHIKRLGITPAPEFHKAVPTPEATRMQKPWSVILLLPDAQFPPQEKRLMELHERYLELLRNIENYSSLSQDHDRLQEEARRLDVARQRLRERRRAYMLCEFRNVIHNFYHAPNRTPFKDFIVINAFDKDKRFLVHLSSDPARDLPKMECGKEISEQEFISQTPKFIDAFLEGDVSVELEIANQSNRSSRWAFELDQGFKRIFAPFEEAEDRRLQEEQYRIREEIAHSLLIKEKGQKDREEAIRLAQQLQIEIDAVAKAEKERADKAQAQKAAADKALADVKAADEARLKRRADELKVLEGQLRRTREGEAREKEEVKAVKAQKAVADKALADVKAADEARLKRMADDLKGLEGQLRQTREGEARAKEEVKALKAQKAVADKALADVKAADEARLKQRADELKVLEGQLRQTREGEARAKEEVKAVKAQKAAADKALADRMDQNNRELQRLQEQLVLRSHNIEDRDQHLNELQRHYEERLEQERAHHLEEQNVRIAQAVAEVERLAFEERERLNHIHQQEKTNLLNLSHRDEESLDRISFENRALKGKIKEQKAADEARIKRLSDDLQGLERQHRILKSSFDVREATWESQRGFVEAQQEEVEDLRESLGTLQRDHEEALRKSRQDLENSQRLEGQLGEIRGAHEEERGLRELYQVEMRETNERHNEEIRSYQEEQGRQKEKRRGLKRALRELEERTEREKLELQEEHRRQLKGQLEEQKVGLEARRKGELKAVHQQYEVQLNDLRRQKLAADDVAKQQGMRGAATEAQLKKLEEDTQRLSGTLRELSGGLEEERGLRELYQVEIGETNERHNEEIRSYQEEQGRQKEKRRGLKRALRELEERTGREKAELQEEHGRDLEAVREALHVDFGERMDQVEHAHRREMTEILRESEEQAEILAREVREREDRREAEFEGERKVFGEERTRLRNDLDGLQRRVEEEERKRGRRKEKKRLIRAAEERAKVAQAPLERGRALMATGSGIRIGEELVRLEDRVREGRRGMERVEGFGREEALRGRRKRRVKGEVEDQEEMRRLEGMAERMDLEIPKSAEGGPDKRIAMEVPKWERPVIPEWEDYGRVREPEFFHEFTGGLRERERMERGILEEPEGFVGGREEVWDRREKVRRHLEGLPQMPPIPGMPVGEEIGIEEQIDRHIQAEDEENEAKELRRREREAARVDEGRRAFETNVGYHPRDKFVVQSRGIPAAPSLDADNNILPGPYPREETPWERRFFQRRAENFLSVGERRNGEMNPYRAWHIRRPRNKTIAGNRRDYYIKSF
jgi:hypothetical protein